MNHRFNMFTLIVLTLVFALLFANTVAAQATQARSGSWYDPDHNGEGFIVQFYRANRAVVYWFTYTEDGEQRWFTAQGRAAGNVLEFANLEVTSGGVFGPDFDADQVIRMPVGSLTLTFNSDSSALAEYTVNGTDGQQNLQRLTRPVEVASAPKFNVPRKSGSWYDPTRSGEGIISEILRDGRQVTYWFTYDLEGNQAWMVAIGGGDARQGSFRLNMQQPVGGRFGPDFDPAEVVYKNAGQARIGLSCTDGYADFKSSAGSGFVDIRFDLRRIVGIGPEACSDPTLTNLFPITPDSGAAFPEHEAGQQLRWLFGFLSSTDDISDDEIREHFSSGWLQANNVAATRALLNSTRANYPNPRFDDPVGMTPIQITGTFSGSEGREAFFVLGASLAENRISNLQVFDYGPTGTGSTQYFQDRNLNLGQAIDKFALMSSQPGLLVARINEANQCVDIAELNADTPRATASIFKIWILAAVADAVNQGALFHDQVVPLNGSLKVRGGPLFDEPNNLPLSIDELSTLMLGVSDNTATDMLLNLAGRDRTTSLHAEYGHSTPELMAPQLGISETFHLFFSFPLAEALTYVNGTEQFQKTFLETKIVPLGSVTTGGGGFNNESLFIDGSWLASPRDVCGAFARHRLHAPGSDAALLVERALQVQAAQPNVREQWDRVWYKGGNLVSGTNGQLVLTHAFMLEREGEQPIAVVAMANDPAGGIDTFEVQSIVGRILELAAGL